MYIPNAGWPFADVAIIGISRAPPGHSWPISQAMLARPRNQLVNGGISHTASAVSIETIWSTSLRQNAST